MFDSENGNDLDVIVDRIKNAIVACAKTVDACKVAFKRLDVGMYARILFEMDEASSDFFGGSAIELDVECFGIWM